MKNIENFREDKEFNDKIWISFSGDKGGGSTKFHIEIINDVNSGSRDVCHTYCMFEVPDNLENIWKVFNYQSEIKQLQNPNFTLATGHKVKVFLGGDYEFIDKSLGHQGQGSTFPSLTDLVTLSHLRNHEGKPHSQDECQIEVRDRNDYTLNFSENLQDDRNYSNRRKNGHEHNSVIGAMVFPLNDLSNIIPPILHMHLGIVLELYNELEN